MPPRPPKSVVTPTRRPKAPAPPTKVVVKTTLAQLVRKSVNGDQYEKVRKHKKLFGNYNPSPEVLMVHGLSRERFDKICRCLDAFMENKEIARFCEVAPRVVTLISTQQLHKPVHKQKVGHGDAADPTVPSTVDWRKGMTQQYGEDGLPVTFPDLTGLQRPSAKPDLPKLLERLTQLSKAELQHIVDYQTLDGRGLSIGVVMYAQCVLDCVAWDAKTRVAALKLISDRMHGSAVQRLANADGSNIDPFQSLVNPVAARWKPVEIESEDVTGADA